MANIYFNDNDQLDNLIFHLKNMDIIFSTHFIKKGFLIADKMFYENVIYLTDEFEAEFELTKTLNKMKSMLQLIV